MAAGVGTSTRALDDGRRASYGARRARRGAGVTWTVALAIDDGRRWPAATCSTAGAGPAMDSLPAAVSAGWQARLAPACSDG
jgi:hypothetical protein